MIKYIVGLVLLALVLGSIPICNAAESTAQTEAQATFKSLYGDEIARTRRTSAISDDIKLAGKLLEAAGTSRDQPELLKLICNSAYDLGRRSSTGYDVAIEAMHVLSANAPDDKPQCLDKIVLIHQLRYARTRGADKADAAGVLLDAMMNATDANAQAGNITAAKAQCLKASRLAVLAKLPQKTAIQAKYKELVAMERSEKLVASHKKRLQLDPSNLASREALIKIYLVERNDPAAAAKWLNEDCDERLQMFIPMAAGDIGAIAEPTLMEMGDWYKSMAASAQLAHKGGMLLQAKRFYEAYMAKHTAADIARTRAILALSRVNADIKKYGVKEPIKVDIPVAASKFSGVSRRAAVTNPTKIPGVTAWTVELRQYAGHFKDVEFSNDSTQIITGGSDGAIRFWDAASGKQVRMLMGHNGEIRDLAWSRDRKTLASGSTDRTIRLWNTETGKTTAILSGASESIYRMAWSPDGLRIASSGYGSAISVWAVRDKKLVGKLKATDNVYSLDWNTSGELATAAGDGNVTLWNVRTGKPYGHYPVDQYLRKGKARNNAVHSIAYSPSNPRLMAAGISTGEIKLWKPRTRIFPQIMKAENKDSRGRNRVGAPSCIKWSPSARMLAVSDSGSYGGYVWFWHATGKKAHRVREHGESSVYNISWSPNGEHVATASSDATSCLIESDTGEILRRIRADRSRGSARPAYSPDGKTLAYACRDMTIRLWDLVNCKPLKVISLPSKSGRYVTQMLWSPDSKKIAYMSYKSGTVSILDIESGVVASSLPAGDVHVYGLVWTPDSKKIFISQSSPKRSEVGMIKLWDVESTGVDLTLSDKSISTNYGLALSSDGKMLASSASRGKVNLWDVAEKKLVRTIGADERTVRGMTFSPDGKKIATCGDESVVKVWSVSTGQPIFGLKRETSDRHPPRVNQVAFSPDGTKLASADEKRKISVWDMSTGKNLAWFGGSNWHLAWLKDSKTIAAAGGSGVSFYNAANGARKAVYYHMPKGKGLIIAASGHYSGTPGVESELFYQAVTVSGQSTMSQEDFAARFGWKNDPTKVKLIEGAQATTQPSE